MTENNRPETLFDAQEWLRYTRHIQLPQLGAQGQTKLKQSHVVIVGAGGLGSPVSLYLAAAGVGNLTIVDHDHVDITNLQRQILFTEADLGLNKAQVGAKRLKALNSKIDIHAVSEGLNDSNAIALLKNADLVLDCTDNFSTRYLINDTCLKLDKAWLSASIRQFSAQLAYFTPNTGCFRCLHPEPPSVVDDCNSSGVMGVLPGITGSFQANEAIKILCNLDNSLEGKLMLFDTLSLSFQKVQFNKNPDCPACNEISQGANPLSSTVEACRTGPIKYEIEHQEFKTSLELEDILILDVRDEIEHKCFHLGGENIALNKLNTAMPTLSNKSKILCYCQTGSRSLKATLLLRENGLNAFSLKGGIVEYLKSAQ